MGKSLADLDLKDEPLPTAGELLDNLPDFGAFGPPPQPGRYRFRLPQDLSSVWDTFEAGEKGTRVVAGLDLLITEALDKGTVGRPFSARLDNNERARGRGGVVASALDYLIAAIDGPQTPKPQTNTEYVRRVAGYGGKEVGGDIRWSWRCGAGKNIRVEVSDGAGGTRQQEVEGKLGCGAAYYQTDVEKAGLQTEHGFPLYIKCACGASLRAFANLDNIRT